MTRIQILSRGICGCHQIKRCIKVFLTLVTFFIASTHGIGQANLTKIPLPKKKVPADVQVIGSGDEFLLSFKNVYPTSTTKPYYFYWVDNQGTARETELTALHGKLICGITDDRAHTYFHYFEKDNKNITLNTIKLNQNSGEATTGLPAMISGRFLGITGDEERIVVYSYEKKTFQLKLTEKIHDRPATEKIFNLSLDFSKYPKADIAFIAAGAAIGAEQAASRVKIFADPSHVRIVADDPFDQYASTPQNNYKTVVIDINIATGEVSNRMIPETSRGNFRSFPLSKYLFRTLTLHNSIHLQMYDLEQGKFLSEKQISNDERYKEHFVFFREGRAGKISKSETLARMIKFAGGCVPFLTAHRDPHGPDAFIITWGTYFNDKGMMPLAGGDAIGLIVMAVGTTIKQLSDGPGISRYFYVRGSADGGFEFAPDDSIDIARRRIDSFELESLTKDVKRLGYFNAGESVIGVYHDQASWAMWVTRF